MPTETLKISSTNNNKISFEPTSIYANSGLAYPRLIIPLKLTLNPLKEDKTTYNFTLMNTQAELYLQNQS